MKKTILATWLLVFIFQAQAQTDVTSLYVTNAGFDENFNYGISATGNVGGDVVNEVFGWTKDMDATFTVAGTFAYGSGATFNGSSAIPGSGYSGSTGGALALSTGWGVQLRYAQTATLPSGKYALVSAYYNAGTATTGSSLLGWTPVSGQATVSNVSVFPAGSWITDTVEFMVPENISGKIQTGFQAIGGSGSGSSAKILVDYVKVLYYGIDKTELNEKIAMADALYVATGIDADIFLGIINAAKAVSANDNATMGEIVNATNNVVDAALAFQLANASDETPLDMTHYIANPYFESGFDNWENNGMAQQSNANFPYKVGSYYIEKWVNRGSKVPDVSIQQTLENIPNGKYTLFVSAGNIQQMGAGSTVNNSATPQTGVAIFAGNDVAAVDTLKENYAVDFYVLDNGVTIGLKAEGATGNWIMCDNFRLQYKGLDLDEIAAFITSYIAEAQILLSEKMQNAAKLELEAAIIQAQQAVTPPLVVADLDAAKKRLSTSIDVARISIAAYSGLQTAIDSALVVAAENLPNGNDALQAAISNAQTLAENLDTDLTNIYSGTDNIYAAILAFRVDNGTGRIPVVVTNPKYARGATAAFGRSTVSGVPSVSIKERGFCWATHPEPTVLDNRTTKYFSNNGNIYHIQNLQPATVYYMRAYAMTNTYMVGYGDVIKVITIPKGTITYNLNSSVVNAPEHHERIAAAMKSAVEYWNNLTSIQGHRLSVNYNAGTPTAEASYGGYMQFGAGSSYQQTGTALHEMGHTIGVGQHKMWYGPDSPLRANGTRGAWLGNRANEVLQFLEDDDTAYMTGDNVHMWPTSPTRTCLAYGVNGAGEDSGAELLYIGNSLITQGLGEDGLPPTGGFATPAYTFEHNDETKYYIKSEHESRGRDTDYLMEDASGNLVYKTMTAEEAAANNQAAWYFEFNPATAFYSIRNVATGKYFTYKSTASTNGVGLISKTIPAGTEYFQLMPARVNTEMSANNATFITKGYWIVYPQQKLNPPCFVSGSNGYTASAEFNFSDMAKAQRWLLLSEEENKLFFSTQTDLLPATNKDEAMRVVNCEGGILIMSNDAMSKNVSVYSTVGQIIQQVVIDSNEQFVPLRNGIYLVNNQKVIVR